LTSERRPRKWTEEREEDVAEGFEIAGKEERNERYRSGSTTRVSKGCERERRTLSVTTEVPEMRLET